MFWHQFNYRVRVHLRDRSLLFWNALFPLIMMTVFAVVLLPLGENAGENLNIPVAIVENEYWHDSPSLQATIDAVSSDDSSESGGLLASQLMSEEDALDLLEQGEVDGVIIPAAADALTLRVMASDLNQSVLHAFTNQYTQTARMVNERIQEHPQRTPQILAAMSDFDADHYFARDSWADQGNSSASYFFALIGMVVLYNMTFAIYEISQLLGNQSPQGARLHVSPARRSTILGASLLFCFIIQYVIAWIMLLYMDRLLGIEMLDYAPWLALLMAVATLCTIGLGLLIGILLKAKVDTKVGLAIGFSTFMAFLAGMMSPAIRSSLLRTVPHLARLNPAELMADSLFAIYFFDRPERVLENSLIFGLIALVSLVAAGFLLRRQNYESI